MSPAYLLSSISQHLMASLSITLVLMPAIAFPQAAKPGSLNYLRFCNGYEQITLGSDANLIPNGALAFLDGDNRPDADSCLKWQYKNEEALKVNEDLTLDLVAVRTYKNKVANVYLFFKRGDGFKVLQWFISLYGQFTDKPDAYMDIYNWNTSKLNLSLRYELKADLGIAIFTSKDIQGEIELRRQKSTPPKMNQVFTSIN